MADPLAPGSVFAGHRIEGLVGRGGMGVVYKATHLALDHVVALKVISPALAQDPRFRRRFGEESRIAVSIRHPNVVAIHHAGEEDGLLFVTMDLIDGIDLRELLRDRGRMSPDHAAAVISEVGAALDAAHARGLVHRDVKPGNILIEGERSEGRVYLTDFGLARRVEASTGITATEGFVGTLDYVAPEQIRGERVDARADVYALGCVLFELVTGNPPFAARDEEVAKLYAHLQEEPPSLPALLPGLSGELDLAVRRALAKDPEARFPSAGDFVRSVWAAVQGQPTVRVKGNVAVGAAAPGPPEATTTAERQRLRAADPTMPRPGDGADRSLAQTRPHQSSVPPNPRATVAEHPAPSSRRARRGPLLAVGAAAIAAVVAGAALISGGGDGGSSATATQRSAQASGGGSGDGGASATPDASIDGAPVAVGKLPVGLFHGERGLWVANRKADSVSFVDGDPAREVDEFAAPGAPEAVVEGGGSLWVSSAATDTLLRLDLRSGALEDRIAVGDLPGGVAFGDGSVWVANGGEDTISRIDPESGYVRTIAVGAGPYGIALDDGAVWVSNRDDDSVTRINASSNHPDPPIAVGDNPKGIAVAGGVVWVANTDDGTVSQVANGAEQQTTGVGPEPRGVVSAFGSIWVSLGGADQVARIDPATGEVAQTLDVGSGPEGITAGPKSVWVANGIDNDLTRIDPGVAGP